MAQVLAALIGLGLLAAAVGFVRHVASHAQAAGRLPVPRVPPLAGWARTAEGKRPPGYAKARIRHTGARAGRSARTVRVIAAEALATDWLAGRAHKRGQPASPKRRVVRDLLTARAAGRAASPVPAPARPAQTVAAAAPAQQASPPNGRHLAAVPGPPPVTPPGGTPMTTPTAAPVNGSAAADLMSAVHRLTTEAQAGSIRAKIGAHLAMGEGFNQQAAALEQHARALSEAGQYPAAAWEPVMQAAGLLRAAAAKMAESGNFIAHIAKTPAGELAGMAPAREELNRA